ncbi:hypothetical protein EVAR_88523_1 [Eumeta japonica]|uniref:Uncharacterized protein n=1 Tax=Eumeta variegata TaxID=151549 RepID=A0A4C1WND6_EUMVA|nr:hypothetical protein EVAR_88523_1 [Eumeta japonica]
MSFPLEGFKQMAYYFFYPSVQSNLKDRICAIYGIYFTSQKSAQTHSHSVHGKTAQERRESRLRPQRLAARRANEPLYTVRRCETSSEGADWLDDDEVDASGLTIPEPSSFTFRMPVMKESEWLAKPVDRGAITPIELLYTACAQCNLRSPVVRLSDVRVVRTHLIVPLWALTRCGYALSDGYSPRRYRASLDYDVRGAVGAVVFHPVSEDSDGIFLSPLHPPLIFVSPLQRISYSYPRSRQHNGDSYGVSVSGVTTKFLVVCIPPETW